ncbi:hypothetical protein EG19_07320 [Thermoanaerobaculum aquaticum]|uniref:DUF7948 domain-containing protein n=2 Tax=Thermoanaerobaculum aquaticum TaxID=1312852 RepID=A0A062XQT0_9BACT|nr:hypothetical protein EG19_07320 [Thermoanaerobaculum aquaticum]
MDRQVGKPFLCLLALGLSWLVTEPVLGAPERQAPTQDKFRAAVSVMPRGFVPNAGQWDQNAAFSALGFYGATWVTHDGELRHVLPAASDCEQRVDTRRHRALHEQRFNQPCEPKAWVLSERFVGGKVRQIRGMEELEGKVSFFIGNDPRKHQAGLPTYRYLDLGEVYPGIRVKLAASQRTVEKLFELAPGTDPGKIQVKLEGAEDVHLRASGELIVKTGFGNVVLSKPIAWQEKGEIRQEVEVSYRLDKPRKEFGFSLGPYDRSKSLWIDPLLQSTYLGGSGYDAAFALAVHPLTGEVYVTGETASLDFPGSAGGAQATYGGGARDCFVTRLSHSLTQNLQSTYLGGTGNDEAYALAINPSTNEVYVAGTTSSPDFPNTAGGAQSNHAGFGDAFLARFDASLAQNLQSTYLGGSDGETALAVVIHAPSGEVYLTGFTWSDDFPNTAGGAQPSPGGWADAFVARLNASLTQNLQSTYIGGPLSDGGSALAIHPATGEVYVAGDFGLRDAFVSRLSASLTSSLQTSFLGGWMVDYATSLAIHPQTGEVYVAGYTESSDFPNTDGGAQSSYAGGTSDAFVSRLDADLSTILQSTYLGGFGEDSAAALAIHPISGEIYVAGTTSSSNFPNTAGGAQAICNTAYEAVVARLNPLLTVNPQSTCLGGTGWDFAYTVGIYPVTGEVYVAGSTDSIGFPNATGGAQENYGGGFNDAFVARLTPALAAVADMQPSLGFFPSSFGPGSVYPGLTFSCTNNGPDDAVNATCSIAASAGTISNLTCLPSVPVAVLAVGSSTTCTFQFTAPDTQGGQDTPQTGVMLTVTAGTDNEADPSNNTASTALPIPLVDALDDAASFPASTRPTYNVGANDQYGTGSLPANATFTLLGTTTCPSSSIGAGGVTTFQVPASGTCVVAYRVCVDNACDTAELLVTAQEPIPTLNDHGLVLLAGLIVAAGLFLLRRAAV